MPDRGAVAEGLDRVVQRPLHRDEVLDTEIFSTLLAAPVIAKDWRRSYNRLHPHSALGMLAPEVFAASWKAIHEGSWSVEGRSGPPAALALRAPARGGVDGQYPRV